MSTLQETSENLLSFCGDKRYSTIYADPPWRFQNRTGKVAPENKKLTRYETMSLEDIMALPVEQVAAAKSHLYLWVPNALLPDGLAVMKAWGFEYKGNIIWEKVRKDGGPDGRGVGFYFRNVTEILLFGVKGDNFRTLAPARSQVNLIRTQKREHSRKPDEIIPIIESCSPGPFLELFARGNREGWDMWGNQATADYEPTWSTYSKLVLVQSKWRRDGTGGISQEEAGSFAQGVKRIINSEFEGCNAKISAKQTDIIAALKDMDYQIEVIFCHTGNQCITDYSKRPITDLLKQVNEEDVAEILVFKEIKLQDIYDFLASSQALDDITIDDSLLWNSRRGVAFNY